MHAASHVPHAMREPSVHAELAHFGELTVQAGAFSSPGAGLPAYL